MTNVNLPSQAGDILNYVRGQCRLGSAVSPNAALQNPQMLAQLNDVCDWFWGWSMDHGMQPLQMFRKECQISTKSNTTLLAAISAGTAGFSLTSGTDFGAPTAALFDAAFLKNSEGSFDFFSYAARATDALSLVEGIDIDHAITEEVHRIYGLPADFGAPRALKLNKFTTYPPIDGDEDSVPPPGVYQLKYIERADGANRMFVVMPENVPEATFTMYYLRRPARIIETTDKIDAPNGLARMAVIEKMKEYVWDMRGEEAKMATCREKADDLMERYTSRFAQLDYSSRQGPLVDMDI